MSEIPHHALRNLPFETEIALCHGRDLVRLAMDNPLGTRALRPDIV